MAPGDIEALVFGSSMYSILLSSETRAHAKLESILRIVCMCYSNTKLSKSEQQIVYMNVSLMDSYSSNRLTEHIIVSVRAFLVTHQ
jgi:hypothetical protein